MPNAFDQFDAPPAKGNAFDQFDAAPAAAPPKPLLHQILDYAINSNPAVGAIEDATQAATGAVARIPAGLAGAVHAGLNAAGLTHGEPADTVHGVEHALTYEPRTSAGQEGDRLLSQTADLVTNNPVTRAVDPVLGKLADATGQGPLIRSAVPAIADAAGNVLPLAKGLGAVRTAAEEAPSVIGKPSDAAPLATSRGAGFPTTASNIALRNPTQQPGIIEQARELVQGGNSTLTAGNNAKATARATQLAGQQMGLGDKVTKITVPNLKTAKFAPGADYDLTGQALGDFKPTSNMQNLLKDAATDNSVDSSSAARTAANRVLSQIDAETGHYQGGGAQLVKDISSLRESSNTRPIANILEDEMDRQAQNSLTPNLVQKYRNARRQFAQIYTVQDVLRGGQVDPQAIGNVHQANPNLLTGNLRLIGTAAQELPADVKLPTQADGVVDSLIRGGKSILGAPARALLNTDAAQNRFGPMANAGGRSYFPTFGERPAPGAEPLRLALAPGKVGAPTPSQVEIGTNPSVLGKPITGPATTYARDADGKLVPTAPEKPGKLPEGPGSVSGAPMASRAASDLIRPLGQAFEPGQRSLLDGGNVNPNWKDPGPAKIVKPAGMRQEDWDKLVALGFGE